MNQINELYKEMINYYKNDPKRIQHFTKVHSYAKLIGELEALDSHTQYILELSALCHDIGIKIAEEKYGNCNGKLQEQEGPAIAKPILEKLGIDSKITNRVLYLIAHHHTYSNIQGIDYQILIEADFLVNLFEDHAAKDSIHAAYSNIFKTTTGRKICKDMFLSQTTHT